MSYLFTLQILLVMTLMKSAWSTDNELLDNGKDFAHQYDKRMAISNSDFMDFDMMARAEMGPFLPYFDNDYVDERNTFKEKRELSKPKLAFARNKRGVIQPNKRASKRSDQHSHNPQRRAPTTSNWGRLKGMWGKRSAQFDETN